MLIIFAVQAHGEVGYSSVTSNAVALRTATIAPIYDAPDGQRISYLSANKPFTSNESTGTWLRITGHFPDGGNWQPAPSSWWIHSDSLAKDILPEISVEPRTYEAKRILRIKEAPGSSTLVEEWESGTRLTSNRQAGDWIRVTGYFPGKKWEPNQEHDWWVHSSSLQDITKPSVDLIPLPEGHSRYIVINKTTFELEVFEVNRKGEEKLIFSSLVGLGIDRCLPEEQGGNCYFTEPGAYNVRWKIYEPDGIEWCIPPSMEKEERYADAIARGQRCFPGALGNFALNIGKTYAIHGTQNLDSIGRRSSSGCIRTENAVSEHLYRLMREGDAVYIVEDEEHFTQMVDQPRQE
ncbi:L,D-transpeptidase [Desulfurispira natronophila]|uniref:L,D-TPase catalytic domain-containing protein n=1 Tax=Desulfurispira natronophila TaxID=682562 RepID=A0A7W8DHT5_9BACT|nr:L,D-transpeptidase [Desulfurispira natronophila]MBB5022784.1 hypothetical protein [Desulfurispira natronophila]